MADNTNQGSSSDTQGQQANASDSTPAQDKPLNLDFGPPVTGKSNTSGESSDKPLNLDFGPPVSGRETIPTDTTGTPETAQDEPFVGTGGVGSPEYMEALRRGHEQAGGDYASDLRNPNDPEGGTPA